MGCHFRHISILLKRSPEEAIGWYEQRIYVEKDRDAKKIMKHAQQEEFIHFAMDLEFLLRKKKDWRLVVKNILFKEGDIIENAEKAEDKAEVE
ncbi:ferritin family protein [Niabella drilacis]